MKLLLVHPRLEANFFNDIQLPPLGLAYIAGVLRGAGHSVRIFDSILSKDQLRDVKKVIAGYRPDIVGISATSSLAGISFQIARLIKDIDPRTTTVFGGVHATVFPHQTIQSPDVDYVVCGEGEYSMLELARSLEESAEPKGIPGIVYKRNGEIAGSNPANPIADLDRLPFPAYELLPLQKYHSLQIARTPFASMVTSRGCPYQCIFCSARLIMGRKFRFHSPERTVEEIKYLKERFGVKEVVFKDSEFTLDIGRVEKICDLLMNEKVEVAWSCNGRVGRMSHSLLRKMRAAGCRLIEYGVESGDDDILNELNKQIKVDEVRQTFALTREVGMKTIANFMIGNPGESRASIAKTLRLAKEINPDYCDISYLTPFPGTRLYEMAQERGWLLDNYDFLKLRVDECAMNATRMSTDELRRMFKRAYWSFYLRPAYIVRRMFHMTPNEWRMNVLGLLKILDLGRQG